MKPQDKIEGMSTAKMVGDILIVILHIIGISIYINILLMVMEIVTPYDNSSPTMDFITKLLILFFAIKQIEYYKNKTCNKIKTWS